VTSMYTRLCSSVLFPAHERLKGHASTALRKELERSQWLSAEQLATRQQAALAAFLARAVRDVPYYQEVAANFGDQHQRWPFLTKDIIRDNTERLKSKQAGRLIRYTTGGSSGAPLVFYMGPGRVDHDVAAKWRATRWWNVDIGDPEVVLWGSPIELGSQDKIRLIRDKLLRSHLFPAFQMSPKQMSRYLTKLKAIRPRQLFGYASALALLAQHASDSGENMSALGIRVVFATGETLYPDQRALIERVFAAPVANGYGSRDAGFIAHQCPAGSLHVSTEHIVVELVNEGGHSVPIGQTGEIVVTHLGTADFPFIRYRTGDRATMQAEPCGCGRGLPVLKDVQGRSTDFVHTPSGNSMHALALIYEVRDKPGVSAFKFIQQKDLSLDLQLVVGSAFSVTIENAIREGLEKRIGQGCVLRITHVERIEAEKSGKYRYVISHAQAPRGIQR
jgi:phenylacetate-CoA ligase